MSDVSPYMVLTLPTVSETLGPLWAAQLNTALGKVDAHDHSPGKGKFVSPSGLNIDSDLPFGSNNATGLRSVRFVPQVSTISQPSDLSCLYSAPDSTGDLYYNDGAGNQIRITVGGSIDVSGAGSISGMGGTDASVTYSDSTKTFTFDQDTDERAFLDIGTLTIREDAGANTNGVTIQAPSGLAANYTMSLPDALPGSTQWVTLASSGALGTSTADTIAAGITATGANNIASAMTSTGADAIGADMTSTGSNAIASSMSTTGATAISNKITRAVASPTATAGQVARSGLIDFSSSSTTYTNVTNANVTITGTGNPIVIVLVPDNSAQSAGIFAQTLGGASATADFMLRRDGVDRFEIRFRGNYGGATSSFIEVPPGSLQYIDWDAPAGTYTYLLQGKTLSGTSPSFGVAKCQMIAYELH